MAPPALSIVVPAFNEIEHLEATVREIDQALRRRFATFEIIIVDDTSTDGTDALAESIASDMRTVRVLHHAENKGLAGSIWTGIQAAQGEYCGWYPADDNFPGPSLDLMFNQVGQADVVFHHTLNPEVRPLLRQVLSTTYTSMMNSAFALNLKYFNGPAIYRTELVRRITPPARGFVGLAQIAVRLLRTGCTFLEVGAEIRDRKRGATKAFHPRNIAGIARGVGELLLEAARSPRPVLPAASKLTGLDRESAIDHQAAYSNAHR